MVYSTIYNIGDIRIKVNFLCPFLLPKTLCGSQLFIESSEKHDWIFNIDCIEEIDLTNLQTVFKGAQSFEEEIPYKWKLLKNDSSKFIHFEFEKDIDIHSGLATINEKEKAINLQLITKPKETIEIDPFFHPIGILILQYIVHSSKGFIMHASAVNYNGAGFLFSAVSGTGKTTMAKLWQKKGATIINDDRIIVNPHGQDYYLYNTPMPYYKDVNKSVQLNKLFIIKQSPHNYIKPLSTTSGILSVLSNCIQYHFNELQIKERLDYITKTVESIGVYEVGFKPDTEIIDLILNKFG